MDQIQRQLLLCLRAFRLGEDAAETTESFSPEDWRRLYSLAAAHKISPVVYETLWSVPGFCGGDPALAAAWKRDAITQAAGQTARTQKLLELTGALDAAGVRYAVLKGAVCRQLYRKPDLRPSGDEDIFVPLEERSRCGEIFTHCGLAASAPDEEDCVDHWQDPCTGLHIELHTKLFSSGWPAETVLNPYFSEQLLHSAPTAVEENMVLTLKPTAHFLFLVSHAMKHFIMGGFGVRTLSDILSFAERYQESIDRNAVWGLLEQIHGTVFFEHLLSIGQAWLAFDPSPWGRLLPDPSDSDELLNDMLDAGIYGQTSMDRKHSAALALRAVRTGQTETSLRAALFPPASQLKGRYPILRRAPALLPAVWLHRMGCYGLEVLRSRGKGNSPRETVSLGTKRTEMMVRYGILPQAQTEDR